MLEKTNGISARMVILNVIVTYGCNDMNIVETAELDGYTSVTREAVKAHALIADVVIGRQNRSVVVDATKLALVVRKIEVLVCTLMILI